MDKNYRRIIKVFLGSPGGLTAERAIAQKVVDEFNEGHEQYLEARVELVKWERSTSRFGRSQELINEELDQCEYFIGMMGKKWGTNPGGDNKWTSGFEEEFERSKARREKTGSSPEISLLFKRVDTDDPGDELKKVLEFQEKIRTKQICLYETFANETEFEARFRNLITDYAMKSAKPAAVEAPRATTKEGIETKGIPAEDDTEDEQHLFGDEARTFLSPLVNAKGDYTEITANDVARLRLNAMSLSRTGNDELTLGAHDANLLFGIREQLELTHQETAGLISAGLNSYSSENIPIWHWLTRPSSGIQQALSVRTLSASDASSSALQMLLLIGQPLEFGELKVSQQDLIERWFDDDTPEKTRISALNYLSRFGSEKSLPIIESQLVESKSNQLKQAAADAAIAIASLDGADAAIDKLNALQPESLSDELLEKLCDWVSVVKESKLVEGVSQPNKKVRLIYVEALADRDLLNEKLAQQLTTDSDVNVRLVGLRALQNAGQTFSGKEVKGILIKTAKPKLAGLLGMSATRPTTDDEHANEIFEQYTIETLKDRTAKANKEAFESSRDYDWTPRLLQWAAGGKAGGMKIRAALADGFKTEFEKYDQRLIDLDATHASYVKSMLEFRGMHISRAKQAAFEHICTQGNKSDVPLIRQVLDREDVAYCPEVSNFLGKHGDWSDVTRLITLYNKRRFTLGRSLLFMGDSTRDSDAAINALIDLGKDKLPELIAMDLPYKFARTMLARLTKRDFMKFTDVQLLELYAREEDDVRKAALLQSVVHLSKNKLQQLLTTYRERDGFKYYNVSHWLDFGISVTQNLARAGAKQALQKLKPY